MAYIWQDKRWPTLHWDAAALGTVLAVVAHEQGRLIGKMEGLGFDLKREAHLRTLTEDVIKSSDIEGEKLPPEQVRSSIARRLGMNVAGLVPADRNVEGVVEMMLDATTHCSKPLTQRRLFAWHAALFPTGHSGMRRIRVAAWRDDRTGPMQVVSGPVGHEKIHYEAPPARRLPDEIRRFLAWFERSGDTHPLLVAGLAHFWFVTIHPFDDGNGRIARAIADMALARADHVGQRFYSMSSQIRAERNAYYDLLERSQRAGTNITAWQSWFLDCLRRSIGNAQDTLSAVLDKARFRERFATQPLNERQLKILNRLLDGFEGKLTTTKWAKLARCSQDTAYRDILNLVERGALRRDPGGGRSSSYSLAL